MYNGKIGEKIFCHINALTKISFVIFCGLLVSTEKVHSEEVLYCTDELATGFIKKSGTWKETFFKQKRFTVKILGDFLGLQADEEKFSCYDGGTFGGYHPIICKSELEYSSHSFNFDKNTLRYVRTSISIGGYASTNPTPDTEGIYAGKCEQF